MISVKEHYEFLLERAKPVMFILIFDISADIVCLHRIYGKCPISILPVKFPEAFALGKMKNHTALYSIDKKILQQQ